MHSVKGAMAAALASTEAASAEVPGCEEDRQTHVP